MFFIEVFLGLIYTPYCILFRHEDIDLAQEVQGWWCAALHAVNAGFGCAGRCIRATAACAP
jgi:hypothetical protein